MCCDHAPLPLPDAVGTMLSKYRDMHARRSTDWGNDWARNAVAGVALPGWLPVPLTAHLMWRPEVFEAAAGTRTLDDAIGVCITDADIRGLAVVRTTADAVTPPSPDTLTRLVSGQRGRVDLIVRSDRGDAIDVDLSDSVEIVEPGTTRLLGFDVASPAAGSLRVSVGGVAVAVATVVEAATLELRSQRPVRWSVVDEAGGAWFPQAAPPKWDDQQRPFFHGADCTVSVPAGRLTVSATNGIGSRPQSIDIEVTPEQAQLVRLEPSRRFDPRASGWFSADLHAHANLSGDLVISPETARCMQAGEDLDLLNLVASNLSHHLVYDREAFETTAGRDLPFAGDDRLTRYGAEFRNDLLGHVSALGLSSPPSRYQTGHVPEDGQEDWPPNATMITELRDRGGLVGYSHPVWSPLDAHDPREPFAGEPRSVEARELVADAALGLVDAIELISNANAEGTISLYHRLLDCGLRLAATAGTDVFLSMSHGLNSGPPGWARVYADLNGQPLTVEAYAAAVRRGATLATNGPWLTLDVNGRGPGEIIDTDVDSRLEIRATAIGPGVRHVAIVSADGELARSPLAPDADTEISVKVRTTPAAPTWIAARVIGGRHPEVLGFESVAHTTPVYVDIDRVRVARSDSARWCLRWLDHLEQLVRDHGHYTAEAHRDDVLGVIETAREVYRHVEARGLSST